MNHSVFSEDWKRDEGLQVPLLSSHGLEMGNVSELRTSNLGLDTPQKIHCSGIKTPKSYRVSVAAIILGLLGMETTAEGRLTNGDMEVVTLLLHGEH